MHYIEFGLDSFLPQLGLLESGRGQASTIASVGGTTSVSIQGFSGFLHPNSDEQFAQARIFELNSYSKVRACLNRTSLFGCKKSENPCTHHFTHH